MARGEKWTILGVLLQTDALEGTERLQVHTRLSAGGDVYISVMLKKSPNQ